MSDTPNGFGALEVLTNAEASAWLRLDVDYPEASDAVRALHRLVRDKGLRPMRGCGKTYKFCVDELRRFAHQQTERRSTKPTANGSDGAVGGDSRVIADRSADR